MKQLIQREWRLLLFGFLMTFWSAPGQTYFIALFSGELRSDMGLSHGDFGFLYSAATLLSAVIIVWSGTFLDRVPLRRFALLVVAGVATACVCLAFSQGTWSLLLALLLLRQFGQSLMMMTASTTMVRYIRSSPGTANALSSMGYRFGEALLPALIVAALVLLDWRELLLMCAGFSLVVMIPLLHRLLARHAVRHRQYEASVQAMETSVDDSRRHWQRHEVLRDHRFYLLLPAVCSAALLFTGFIFHSVHLVESKSWSLHDWSFWFAAYAITSMFAALAGGRLVDRIGAMRLIAWLPLPIGIACISLATMHAAWSAGLFLCLMALTAGSVASASSPLYAELYGTRYLGSIKSATSATAVLFSALSPVAMGWALDAGVSFEQLGWIGAGYCAMSIILALLARRAS